MEHLLLSTRVVFPMLFLLALGYGVRRMGLLREEVFDGCTTLVFRAILPVSLFLETSTLDMQNAIDLWLMGVAVGGVVLFWGLSMLAIPQIEPDDRKRGAMVQGCFRSNLVLFGLPVAQKISGDAVLGPIAVVIAIVVPLFNVLAVITLEIFRGGNPNLKKILKGIATNPLIVGAAVGLLWLMTGLELPGLVAESLEEVAGIATPLALIALGGTFHFSPLQGNYRQLAVVMAGKLILMPALLFGLGILAGLRGAALAVLLAVGATPVAVSSFPMVRAMDGDGELAGQLVVFTELLAIISLFCWVYLLSSLGLV